MQRISLANDLITQCYALADVDTCQLLAAVTAPSACDDIDYERLEILGDSVLKATIAMHVFCINPQATAGTLSIEKNYLVSNQVLANAAKKTNIIRFVYTEPLPIRFWNPPGSTSTIFFLLC